MSEIQKTWSETEIDGVPCTTDGRVIVFEGENIKITIEPEGRKTARELAPEVFAALGIKKDY
jgi:hypothetical protein